MSGLSLDARLARYEAAFAEVAAPFAFVDLDAFDANAAELRRRAGGKPIRVATKSLRCRRLIRDVLARGEGFRGLMTFGVGETVALHRDRFEDLLLAYPAVDRRGIAELARLEGERTPAVVVDSVAHLDLIDEAVRAGGERPVRVCIEIDMRLRLLGGRVRIGVKRSSLARPEQVAALAREALRRPGVELAGLMGYEAQVAGVPDRPPGDPLRARVVEAIHDASMRQGVTRRGTAVAAVRALGAQLDFVNGGGTGSLERTTLDPAVTELAAGSGFYAPALFDGYSRLSLEPAALFALPVVRRPDARTATALGGGYIASGTPGRDRAPAPYLPAGLRLDRREGAGEVQTPLLGAAARRLRLGDRVYLRHAKAGELCEHFDRLYLVRGSEVVDEVPTYRGEGIRLP